jgi:hypothetical protein
MLEFTGIAWQGSSLAKPMGWWDRLMRGSIPTGQRDVHIVLVKCTRVSCYAVKLTGWTRTATAQSVLGGIVG